MSKIDDDYCSEKFQCKGNCLMNISGNFEAWDILSSYCKGTLEEQQFMNDIFSGNKSREDVFNKYNLSESEKEIIWNYIGR